MLFAMMLMVLLGTLATIRPLSRISSPSSNLLAVSPGPPNARTLKRRGRSRPSVSTTNTHFVAPSFVCDAFGLPTTTPLRIKLFISPPRVRLDIWTIGGFGLVVGQRPPFAAAHADELERGILRRYPISELPNNRVRGFYEVRDEIGRAHV